MTGPGFRLRRAGIEDAATIARLHRAVRDEALPYLPRLHTPEADLRHMRDHVLAHDAVVIAEGDTALGYCAYREGWLDDLYVLPAWHGRGIGTALLDAARRGQSLVQLWVFQRNRAARRFYERRGFRLIEETDGRDNEEKEPDALYEWLAPRGSLSA